MNNNPGTQRRFPRYPIEVPFVVRAARRGGTTLLTGRTCDFGEGGLGASLEGELSPGELVSMSLSLPHCAITLQPRAQVRYRKDRVHGFEFVDLSALQLAELRQCCRQLAKLF